MLNVLPLTRKITLRRAYIAKELRILAGICIVATSLSVMMVFVSDWVLQRWLDNAAVTTTVDIVSAEERAELKELVSSLVVTANQAQPLLANQHYPLADLKVLLEPTPEGIALHKVALSYATQQLTISGTAATRDDMIAYQQTISGIPGISTVKLPLSDLNLKTDIPFTLSALYATPTN